MHFLFILANACFPMDFLVSALLFIFVTFFPTVTFFNAVCFLNAPAPIETTEYFCFFHVMVAGICAVLRFLFKDLTYSAVFFFPTVSTL